MVKALAFAAEGKVKADIELQPLSDVNDVLDRLEGGKVTARVVLDFEGSAKPLDVDRTPKKTVRPQEICDEVVA